jgi:meiotic recombination protein SPO11
MDSVPLAFAMAATENNPVFRFFENLQLSFLDEFDKDVAQLSVTLKKRPSQFRISNHNENPEDRILGMEPDVSERQMTYSWPGKTPQEAWKFSMWSRATICMLC